MRQYIGARYVPKFFDNNGSTDWVSGVAYEPLTIVTYLGNSYTSKKPVPVGIDILNSDYWASTGLWNSQVEQYRQEVEEIKTENYLNKINRVIAITDSYGTHSLNNWCSYLKSSLGLDDDNFKYHAEGSSGFNHAGLSGHTFEDLLIGALSDYDDPDTVTDIIVGGGTNDFYYYDSLSNLENAIVSFINYAKAHFTNARITICFMGYESQMQTTMRNCYYQTINTYEYMAAANGCRFINAYKYMHYPTLRENHQHPSENGSRYIANCIYLALMGHEDFTVGQTKPSNASATTLIDPADVTSSSGENTISFKIFNDTAKVSLGTISVLRPISINRDTVYELASFDSEDFNAIDTTYKFNIPMRCTLSDDSEMQINFECFVQINGATGAIYFKPNKNATLKGYTTDRMHHTFDVPLVAM